MFLLLFTAFEIKKGFYTCFCLSMYFKAKSDTNPTLTASKILGIHLVPRH